MTLDEAKDALRNGALFSDVYTSLVLTCYNDGLSTDAITNVTTELRRFFCYDLSLQVRWQKPTGSSTESRQARSSGVSAPQPKPARKMAKEQGFEGDPCTTCGAMQVVRNGSCLLCRACGTTTGCS